MIYDENNAFGYIDAEPAVSAQLTLNYATIDPNVYTPGGQYLANLDISVSSEITNKAKFLIKMTNQ